MVFFRGSRNPGQSIYTTVMFPGNRVPPEAVFMARRGGQGAESDLLVAPGRDVHQNVLDR